MTAFNDITHMERQLSSLFRAEAQDANLPLGTWQAISPKMGEPDKRSLFGGLRDAFSFPRRFQGWRNPLVRIRQVRYAAPAATIALAAMAAILFVLLINDDADSDSPVPAVSPTVPVETSVPQSTSTAEATPIRATGTSTATPQLEATPDSVTQGVGISDVTVEAAQRFPNQLASAFDGTSLWFAETQFVARTDLEGNRTGTFQVARNAITSMTTFDGFLWILDAGESELRKVSLDGETISRIKVRGGTNRVFARDGSLWSRSANDRITRYDSEGQVVDELSLDLENAQINIIDDSIWLWKDSKLTQISMTGEELAQWDAPPIPIGESNRSDEIQVNGGYVWLSGYSRTEITRLDPATGDSLVIELPVYVGEFTSNGVLSTFPTVLALEDSVWVAYMRFTEPDLDPSEAGLFFGESSFRRLTVFDIDGKLLQEKVIVQPGDGDKYFQLLFMASLARINRVNDDVWIAYGAEGQNTLFTVFTPEFVTSGN